MPREQMITVSATGLSLRAYSLESEEAMRPSLVSIKERTKSTIEDMEIIRSPYQVKL